MRLVLRVSVVSSMIIARFFYPVYFCTMQPNQLCLSSRSCPLALSEIMGTFMASSSEWVSQPQQHGIVIASRHA